MNIDNVIFYISVTSMQVMAEEEVVVLEDTDDHGDEMTKKAEGRAKGEGDDDLIDLEPGAFTSRYKANVST